MKIQRSRSFTDILELSDPQTGQIIEIHVETNLERAAQKYRTVEVDFNHAQQASREKPNDPAVLEQYGRAILSLFDLFFGEENTKKLLAFYDGQYIDMITDVWPYITGTIVPALQQARDQKVKSMRATRRKW